MAAGAQNRLKLSQKPPAAMKASKRPLKKNPNSLTRRQAIAALSKDPRNDILVAKLRHHGPLTKPEFNRIHHGNIINRTSVLTNTNINVNVNNVTIFNNNTSTNVVNVLAGFGGLGFGLLGSGVFGQLPVGGGAVVVFPPGFVMGCGGVCGGGADGLPPECPSLFFPNDPGAFDDALTADGITDPADCYMPPASGIACAVTPNLPTSYDDDADSVDPTLSADPTFATTGDGDVLGDVAVDDPQGRFSTRYLRVANDTSETVDVFVQYRTDTDQGPTWFPADPNTSDEAISVTLAPGETADIKEGDWRVNASCIRIWAKSPTQVWYTFKTQDLPLVPETDDTGANTYVSNDLQVFNWTVR
jgi:hypothetical protein